MSKGCVNIWENLYKPDLPGCLTRRTNPDNLYRAASVPGDGVRDAPHQELNQAGSAMGANHNKVGAPALSVGENHVSRVAFFD
jgi:hypothetical protein